MFTLFHTYVYCWCSPHSSVLVLSLLHVVEHTCMQPLWQLSGLQAGGIGFEFGPEICTVFCLARCNWLVCKLAEKASFHILTFTPFTDIFVSIWWYMIIFCASEAACVFTRMHERNNQWTLLAFDVRNLHLFYGKLPEYRIQDEKCIFPRESTCVVQASMGMSWKMRWPEREAERGLKLVWSCLLLEHTQAFEV